MEIERGIHCVKSTYAANKPLWVYVLEGDFCLWVDVGINVTPDESVIPYLTRVAPALWQKRQSAIITHADVDHFGGLGQLCRRRPDTIVLAHAADRHWIESPAAVQRERYLMHEADGITLPASRQATLLERGGGGGKVDVALSGGEVIDLGAAGRWQVLLAPGHSPGHIVLWDAARRWALIGDAALDWGVPNDAGELIAPPPYYDADAYEKTVRMLREQKAERVFTSHYGILDGAQAERLYRNSLESIEVLESATMAALARSPEGVALAQLCLGVGREARHWQEGLWPALADPISAHLKRQIARGIVQRFTKDGAGFYRLL